MTDYRQLEQQFSSDLGLLRRPVAITPADAIPVNVEKFAGTVPAGCSFWRIASGGRTFYTVPSDHFNCAIGAYTHNIALPAERESELPDTLGFMTSIGYLRMEEVPGIPRLPSTPAAIIYAPLGETPVDPDVVLFSGPSAQMMLLQEAGIRAGVATGLSTLGRPTCMAVPAAMGLGMVASTGCVGNRVYTGVGPGDLYVFVPGKDVERVAAETAAIQAANATLLEYHRERQQRLATA